MKKSMNHLVVAFGAALMLSGPAMAQEATQKKETYLGVSARDLDEALRAHLDGVPAGTGLMVKGVTDGSPAAKAGVKEHDILLKFNDQKLTSSKHLSTLVKASGSGEKVDLHLLRKGEKKTLPVTLSSNKVVAFNIEEAREKVGDGLDELVPDDIQGKLQDLLGGFGGAGGQSGSVLDDLLKNFGGAGGNRQGGSSSSSSSTVQDNDGRLTLKTDNGQKHLKIEDSNGKVVFDGAIDTDADLAKVPELYREKVKRMQSGSAPANPLQGLLGGQGGVGGIDLDGLMKNFNFGDLQSGNLDLDKLMEDAFSDPEVKNLFDGLMKDFDPGAAGGGGSGAGIQGLLDQFGPLFGGGDPGGKAPSAPKTPTPSSKFD